MTFKHLVVVFFCVVKVKCVCQCCSRRAAILVEAFGSEGATPFFPKDERRDAGGQMGQQIDHADVVGFEQKRRQITVWRMAR